MENKNYDILFQHEIEKINANPAFNTLKPTLLLHVCCAPCSSAVLERLADTFDITIFFYNPNIHPEAEYIRRFEELRSFLKACNSENPVSLCKSSYEQSDFFDAIEIDRYPERKEEAERGSRCEKCYELRMKKTAIFATEHKFDYFTTALSISPHKDASKINTIGEKLELKFQVKYLYADFKKKNGYKRSLEISKQYDLYRQDYCGCIYSKRP